MKIKLKYTGIIEAEECPNSPGMYYVCTGTEIVPDGQIMRLEYIKANFTAVDNNALNLMDPDRTKRLCPPIVG